MPNLLSEKPVHDNPAPKVHDKQVYDRERCDRCGYRAYVEVTLSSGGTLSFCGHHYGQHEKRLTDVATAINDQRGVLR